MRKFVSPLGTSLVAILLASAAPALAQRDPQHYTTPGWYRYIVWHSPDGQEEWDRYIEAGPFDDKASCEATIKDAGDDNDQYCEYFDSDPES